MKILSTVALFLSAGALFAQAPDQRLEGRIQLFAENSRPVAITVVNSPASLKDQPKAMTGVGIRFMGEIASAPNWYYEVGGRLDASSNFTRNGDIGDGNALDLTAVSVSSSYWSLGAAYIMRPVDALSLGLHLEGRGEALSAKGTVYQSLAGGAWTVVGTADVSTTYLRPWVRASVDYAFPMGTRRPYVGFDVSAAITRTEQTQFVSLNLMDNRTLKSLAPNFAFAFYLGARF
jgi:hypothetical protein